MLAGYDHLLRAARRLAWDEASIDLRPDAAAWPRLAAAPREQIRRLVAGFVVAEAAVAEHLAPFEAAAADAELAACFAAQAADERRHARFFARAAREVCAIGDLPAAQALAGPGVRELFERELPARAGALATGTVGLDGAVSLYHLVLEGVAFHTGQHALLALLDEAGTLPGLREGVARVQGDERWHVGLGVRCLQDLGAPPAPGLDALAARAAACWAVDVDAEHALAVHRRRLGVLAPAAASG